MNNNEYGKHLINCKEFNNLLSSCNWLLVKGLKDNWTPMRHIEYIDKIYYHSPNLIKIYTDSNSSSFDTVWTIDVLIKASNPESDTESENYHIQFVKDTIRQNHKPR